MKITIETIPHDQQRIPGQVGDWQLVDGAMVIRVSKLSNWRYEVVVGLHEAVEAMLCMDGNIGTAQVDAFDVAYSGTNEAGDDPEAPYALQHCFATAVERMVIAAMGLSWAEYDAAIEALP